MIRMTSIAFAFAMMASGYADAGEATRPSVQDPKPAAAQEPKPTDPATQAPVTVIVADTAAPQEWEVSVPVAVKLDDETRIGRLTMKLVYSSKVLKFASVKSTETLKGAGFEVTAGTPVVNAETGELPLEFKLTPGATSPKGIPSARIAIVVFKVVKDAEEKTWPMSTKDVQSWAFEGGAPVKTASGPAAKFVVAPAGLPIFGCFFYMH